MKCFFKIMVAVDFSSSSRLAVLRGFDLARALKATIGFIHIIDQHGLSLAQEVLGNKNMDKNREAYLATVLKETKGKKLDDLVNLINELNVHQQAFQSEVKSGEVFQQLIKAISEFEADLLIMGALGTHEKPIDNVGSLTSKMLNNCRVPLVTLNA